MTKEHKRFEELEFTDDFLFAQIMRNQPELCRELLQHILGMEISEIHYLNTQETIDSYLDAKAVRLDVVAKNGNASYNVEMQTTRQKFLAKRSRYYQSQQDIDTLQKGDDYENLPNSFIIFLCTFDPYGQNKCIYKFKYLCESDPSLEMGDGTTKVYVNSKGRNEVDMALKELFSYMNNPSACKPQEHLTKMIMEQVKSAKRNAEWRQMYMKYQLDLSDARKEGVRIGIIESKKISSLNMRKKGFDYETIAEINEVSVDQIKAWEEEACCLS